MFFLISLSTWKIFACPKFLLKCFSFCYFPKHIKFLYSLQQLHFTLLVSWETWLKIKICFLHDLGWACQQSWWDKFGRKFIWGLIWGPWTLWNVNLFEKKEFHTFRVLHRIFFKSHVNFRPLLWVKDLCCRKHRWPVCLEHSLVTSVLQFHILEVCSLLPPVYFPISFITLSLGKLFLLADFAYLNIINNKDSTAWSASIDRLVDKRNIMNKS